MQTHKQTHWQDQLQYTAPLILACSVLKDNVCNLRKEMVFNSSIYQKTDIAQDIWNRTEMARKVFMEQEEIVWICNLRRE